MSCRRQGVAYEHIARARVVAGITILTIPTIMYGGVTLLGILTHGVTGLSPGGMVLNGT